MLLKKKLQILVELFIVTGGIRKNHTCSRYEALLLLFFHHHVSPLITYDWLNNHRSYHVPKCDLKGQNTLPNKRGMILFRVVFGNKEIHAIYISTLFIKT